MIKAENGIFYLTAGETCYILKITKSGALQTVYFGKRLEFEDDLAALGYGSADNADKLFGGIYCGGKKIACEFKVAGAEILSDKPDVGALALDGGKTLKIALSCDSAKLNAEVYITPYPRGGFARRTVLINNGEKPIAVKPQTFVCALEENVDIVSVTAAGEVVRTKCDMPRPDGVNNFIIAPSVSATETHGNVYGFLCAFGDGAVEFEKNGDALRIYCRGDGKIAVGAGERYIAPEMLEVFSYNGVGGMSRAFHDILRESMGDKYLRERRPTVMFCPDLTVNKMCDAAARAGELGLDVFAVDGGKTPCMSLGKISEACKAAGVTFGIKITPSAIEKNSAAYVSGCTEVKPNVFAADLSDGEFAERFIAALEKTIEKYGIEYLMIDVPRGGIMPFAMSLYKLRTELGNKFPELFTEWGATAPDIRYGQSLCYPPCLMRNLVEYEPNTFKALFDGATFGCLGYALNPLDLNADIARAIRAQVFSYQDDAPTVMLGDLYRLESTRGSKCLMAVTKDKSKAYVVCDTDGESARVLLKGLDEHNLYHVREKNKTFSGAALCNCGIDVPHAKDGAGTFVLHIRQVADYE